MQRFTISHHTASKDGDHYDLFLELADGLRTWRLQSPAFQLAQTAFQIKDHRKEYLDLEGDVDGGRGRVKVVDTGTYAVDLWKDDRLQVAIQGRALRARLAFVAIPGQKDDPGPRWTVQDASQEVKKAAASFLRESMLDQAPSVELEDLRESLSREERKIMALVDRYSKGGAVEWAAAEFDPDLRKRVESEKARWQHPWLATAKSYADRLGDLALLVRASRPK